MARKKQKLAMNDRCVYFAGPYKGYCGQAEYRADDGGFHGRVLGTKDVITFEAVDVPGVQRAFAESVDDYLAFCAERNESPDKPYSGRFITRIEPELHRTLSMIAESAGCSLNAFVSQSLQKIASSVSASDQAKPPATSRPKRQLAKQLAAAKRRNQAS